MSVVVAARLPAPTPFEERMSALLLSRGIDPACVMSESVKLVPYGRGFRLNADLVVLLDADAAAELFALDVPAVAVDERFAAGACDCGDCR